MTDEMHELAGALGAAFIARRDVKAVQGEDGQYRPAGRYHQGKCVEYFPWKRSDIKDHLAGTKTYGYYAVTPEGKASTFCLDIDFTKSGELIVDADEPPVTIEPREVWLGPDSEHKMILGVQLRCMAEALALRIDKLLGIPAIVSYSGNKGMHVYGMTGEIEAAEARELAQGLLLSFDGQFVQSKGHNFWKHVRMDCLEIETFPKQDAVREDGGLGNLIRLPLGINRKTGAEAFFVDLSAPYSELRADDPMLTLERGSVR